MPVNIGSIEGSLKLKDNLASWQKSIQSQFQSVSNLPKKFQASLSDLEKQMAKMAKTPSLRADAASISKSIALTKAQNRALEESIAAYRKGPAAVKALNDQREINNRLLAAGVTRESAYGKELESQIKRTQKYRNELDLLVKESKKTSNALEVQGKKLTALGQQMAYAGSRISGIITLPIIALGGFAIKTASDFESSFAGVIKTVDATEDQLAKLSTGFRELSKTIPINVNELNKIGESAGQLGVKTSSILSFTRTIADLGVTTNLSTEEAANGLARLANITGLPQEQFDRLGSTIVDLGNKFAANEREILEFGLRIAGAGEVAGLTESQILAIGTSLASVGVEAEAGGTAVQKVLINMTASVAKGGKDLHNFAAIAGMSANEFKKAWAEDAGLAFTRFVEGLGKQGKNAFAALEALDLQDQRLIRSFIALSNAGGLLRKSMNDGSKAFADNTALLTEAEKRYKTFASQVTILWNRIKDITITLGTSLFPIILDLFNVAEPLIKLFASIVKGFADLPTPLKIAILTFGGLVAAIGPVVYVSGVLITSWGTILTIAPKMAAAITLATGPWGIIAMAIATAILAITTWIHKWREASEEAIQLSVKLGNLEGQAFRFFQEIQRSKGKISESRLIEEKQNAENLRLELNNAKSSLKSLVDSMSVAAHKKFVLAGGDPLKIGREDIADAKQSVKNLAAAYDIQRKALKSVVDVYDLADKPLDDFNTNLNLQGKEVDKIAEMLKDLQNQLSRSLQALKLLKSGVPEKEINALIEAATKLGLGDLFDPLVKQFADLILKAKGLDGEYNSILKAQELLRNSAENWHKSMSENFKQLAGSNDPAMKKLVDDLKEAESLTKSILSDEEKRSQAIQKANELYSRGLIDLTVYQKILIDNADRWNVELTAAQVNYEKIFKSISDGVNKLSRNIAEDLVRAWRESESASEAMLNLLRDSFDNVLKFIISKWLESWFKAMAAWLARWIATQTAAKAAQAGLGAVGTGVGAGGWQSAFGMAGSAAGAGAGAGSGISTNRMLGYGLAAYALFVIYKGFIEDHNRKFAQITIDNGQAQITAAHGKKYLEGVQNAAISIIESVKKFIDDINVNMTRLGTVIIEASKSGVNVKFSPTSTGKLFATMEEAIAYAQVLMLKYGEFADSVSNLVKSVIKNTKAMTPEELAADIDFARLLETQNLDEVAQSIKNSLDVAAEQFQRAKDLFLSFYSVDLPAFAEAVSSILTKLNNDIWAQYNSLAGIEEDPKKAWARKMEAFNLNKKLIDLQLKLWLVEIQGKIKNFNAQVLLVNAHGRLTKRIIEFSSALVGMVEAIDPALQALLDIEQQIKDIIAGLPPDLTEADYPGKKGKGGGGGSGSGDKQSVRDFIKDRTFELSLQGLSEYKRQLAELDRQYNRLLEQAGKDKQLREQLLALKEKELAIIQKELILSVVDRFREFLGLITPFQQVKDTAADLIKSIEESPFGSERKARMIGRILNELENQLNHLSMQMASGLLSSMIADLEKFGAQESLLNEARMHFAIIEHTLKMINYRKEIEILRAEGRITDAVLNTLLKGLEFLENIDPLEFLDRDGTASGRAYTSRMERLAEANEKLLKEMEDARNKLLKYQSEGIDPFLAKLREIKSDFDSIIKVLGRTPEVLDTFNKAVKSAVDDFIQPFKEFRENRQLSELSTLTGEQKFYEAQGKFRAISENIPALLAAGDFDKIRSILDIGQQYGELAQAFTGGEGLRFLMKEIDDAMKSIESLVPDFAAEITGAELGTLTNPINIENSAMVNAVNSTTAAINTGNVLLLTEIRDSLTEQKSQTIILDEIAYNLNGLKTGTGLL